MTHFVQRILNDKDQHSGKQLLSHEKESFSSLKVVSFVPSSANQEQCLQLLSGQRLLFFSKSHIQVLKLTLCKLDVIKSRIHCCLVRS